jgi:hypothetical protein
MLQHLHYFPCINAFAVMIQQPILLFDLSQPFKRSSFRNRTIISGATGPITLSIPIIGGRSIKLPYKEVEIDYNNNWQRDHFRSLSTAYGNSPFFNFYKDELEALYNNKINSLSEWNLICLKWVFQKIKFIQEIKVIQASNDCHLIGEELLKSIHEFTPQNYRSPEMGPFIPYPQIFQERNGFQPNLSILDLIFHHGKDAKSFFVPS